jgi:hypothetical protein
MVYALDEDRRADIVGRCIDAVQELDGVDLVTWCARGEEPEAVVRSRRGELRFAPGGELEDDRGRRWHVEGEPATLRATVADGRFASGEYPDALGRLWSALHCPTAGDVLLSAAPGFEFVDWGGADHLGGGSHGSLHRSDSLGVLMWCGTGPAARTERRQWTLQDVTPMVAGHFGVASGGGEQADDRLASR